MQRIKSVILIFVLSLVTCGLAADLDGTWKSTINSPRGQMDFILKLKTNDNELTGTLTGFRGESEIQNGKINGNRFTFETEMNGEIVTNEGVLSGPTLFVYLGPYQFEIICEKEEMESNGITGKWSGKLAGPDGSEMELVFNIKADNDQLSGTVQSPMGEYPFENTKLDGARFSFDVDVDGMVISHDCTLRDDDTVLMKYMGMGGEEEMVLKRLDK